MSNVRVRFAPSPTGALHIGGVRTALYNYLLARQLGGTFILRIEDTDQNRYVPGAEDYIKEALAWCGLTVDEGTEQGGDYGPYRQSDRKAIYLEHAQKLIDNGTAYYAFDTPEELDARRETEKEAGNHNFRYDAASRSSMRNSESLSSKEVEQLLAANTPYTIRLKVPTDEIVKVTDLVRGDVQFQSKELDDKILLKTDGMPTYHLANIVDDHLMKITHVIRGEEWLPSTAHHVLLYRAFGWEDTMPAFAHLPLILKPTGKGKLSKRDGVKLGIPVFPLAWKGATEEESFTGFREFGFDPRAMVNFMALLGWNPGTEQELFSLEELVKAFSIEKIGKAGARFDFDKAKWFNQQYIMQSSDEDLITVIKPMLAEKGITKDDAFLATFVQLMKERVVVYGDFWGSGYYFFTDVTAYDEKNIRKKWKPENQALFEDLRQQLKALNSPDEAAVEATVKSFMETNGLGFGAVLPILRIGITGTMKGPSIFAVMALLGTEEVDRRLESAYAAFNAIKNG
ncbi:MAG: glutamate--tRNA ligase [Lewinella sp.]|uniref:glutamate--tRNA ligase n=1 Tax=Lewinella sp. TaxID=2004506 RepID=UPI003D6A6A21